MGMLFVLDGGDIFASNPQLKNFGDFSVLSHEEMTYIVMVYDHESILHRLPFKTRQDKALNELGYYNNSGGLSVAGERLRIPEGNIKKAITLFQELLGFNPYILVEGTEKLLIDANEVIKNGVLNKDSTDEEKLDIVDRMKVGKDVAAILKGRQEILDVINPPDIDKEKAEEKKEGSSLVDQIGQEKLDAGT